MVSLNRYTSSYFDISGNAERLVSRWRQSSFLEQRAGQTTAMGSTPIQQPVVFQPSLQLHKHVSLILIIFTYQQIWFPEYSQYLSITVTTFSSPIHVYQVQQQTCILFHKTSAAHKQQGIVLFAQSSFKCFSRSFLCNFLPQFLGQNTSAKSHSFKWS